LRHSTTLEIGFQIALLATVSLASPARADSHTDYMLQCQGCHMADGRGSPGSVPDLRGNLDLFLGVPGGREYLMQVPGSAQSPLSNEKLAEVLNWMIREFGSPEVASNFTAFTADEVRLNREPLADVEPVRKILLDLIRSKQRHDGLESHD